MEVGGSGKASYYEEEIIPDGHHEIIFHLSSQPAKRKPGKADWFPEPAAFIAGQTLKGYGLRLSPGARLAGIRFYPHTLSALFDFPMADLTGKIFPLDDVAPAGCFWDCISENPQKTFLNFERLLLEKIPALDFDTDRYAYVNAAVSEILKHSGNISVEQLTGRAGISLKHLNNLFQKYVGLNPKTVCQILKFNRFIAYKSDNPEKNLTECCYETGYYDQSHLIKSFHLFSDKPPKAYFSDDNFINDTFTGL